MSETNVLLSKNLYKIHGSVIWFIEYFVDIRGIKNIEEGIAKSMVPKTNSEQYISHLIVKTLRM